MRESISNTAEFGDYTRGSMVIDDHVRASMKHILDEIQNGNFARQFMQQHEDGGQELKKLRQENCNQQIEVIGGKLRSMMPWLR